ncbi:MAG: PepSY-associated helix domain protein [Proteobacteria bacterium]|nr:PepSY-associated helix domain protein [Pseudomonadota bacterium]
MSVHLKSLFARELWAKIHAYLALAAGLPFVVLGLSGSLAVYREELDELLNPHLTVENPPGEYLPLDRIMAAVQAAHPRRYAPWTLEMPRSPASMITAWYQKPEETADRLYAPLMVSVNPYTGQVVATRFWGETASTWIADFHTQLLQDRASWNVVGALGLLLMISAASGLYAWWPGTARIRQTFAVRHDAGMVRLAFDLHRGIGFIGAAWLLLIAFTGFNLAFPDLLEGLTASSGMSHGNSGPDVHSTAIPNDRPVSLAEAVLVARGAFRHAEVRRITQPAGETGSYRVNLRQGTEINQRHPFTTVWVDRWSGQILEVRNPAQFTKGESIMAWQWPLHTGEAYGTTGRLLWFFAGFIPLLLYVSGMMVWMNRRGWLADRQVNLAPLRDRLRTGIDRGIYWVMERSRRIQPLVLQAATRATRWIRCGMKTLRETLARAR